MILYAEVTSAVPTSCARIRSILQVSFKKIQEVGSIVSRIVPLVPVYVDEPHLWKLIPGIYKADVSALSFLLVTFSLLLFT
jgi:hypothetical protein